MKRIAQFSNISHAHLVYLTAVNAAILAVAHRDYVTAGLGLVCRLLQGGDGAGMDIKLGLEGAAEAGGTDLWHL